MLTSATSDDVYAPGGARKLPRRILVVRLGAMGDVLHAMPAVAAIRSAIPQVEIGWVIEERWSELLCSRDTPRTGPVSDRRPLVHNVHTVDTRGWRKSPLSSATWSHVRSAIGGIRRNRYDLAIDFQGALKSATVAGLSGAPEKWGFATPREKQATWFYSQTHHTRSAHVIDQNLELASAAVGISLDAKQALLPVTSEGEKFAEGIIAQVGTRFAIVNPGAGWGAKQWPASSYGAVARELSSQGIAPLINFGPGEQSLADEVFNASRRVGLRVSGNLAELVALTRRAAVVIAGDTGPLHLAAALQRPVVAIFGPTDPARNGPYGTASVVLRSKQSKTSYSHVADRDMGLDSITPEDVISATTELLQGS